MVANHNSIYIYVLIYRSIKHCQYYTNIIKTFEKIKIINNYNTNNINLFFIFIKTF